MVSLYIIIFSYMFRPYMIHHQGETWLLETRMASMYIVHWTQFGHNKAIVIRNWYYDCAQVCNNYLWQYRHTC